MSALPINKQNLFIMELFLSHVKKKLKASVVDLKEKQKKELTDHINSLDINKFAESAFMELSNSEEAREVFRGATTEAVKFMLDVNGKTVLEELAAL